VAHEGRELRFGVEPFGDLPGLEQTEVPVVVAHELTELERVAGESRVDGAQARVVVDAERLTIAAAADFEVALAAHEVVLVGIQREQHADAAVGLRVEDQEVTVRLGAGVDLHPVAALQVARLVDPDSDGRLALHGLDRCYGCEAHGGQQ
jgi:hypothetical protein